MKKCNKCKKDRKIVNQFHKLCQDCNNLRLHGSKFGKQYTFNTKKKEGTIATESRLSHKITGEGKKVKIQKEAKAKERIRLDEEFYEKCFKLSNHKCEECGELLNDVFRNDDGDVACRWRYSHIIPKSIAIHLRRLVKNINHLCLKHHTQWDFGDKKIMKIYKENKRRFPNHFS